MLLLHGLMRSFETCVGDTPMAQIAVPPVTSLAITLLDRAGATCHQRGRSIVAICAYRRRWNLHVPQSQWLLSQKLIHDSGMYMRVAPSKSQVSDSRFDMRQAVVAWHGPHI